ncbi:MAG TPA: hypothetical protein VNL36_00730 [Bacteroidota bacterium]|nr:hypothetical protein [Bacteroidota bacterium]
MDGLRERSRQIQCDHECRYDCALLTEALRRESEMGKFYDQILQQCDEPDVRAFIAELMEKRRSCINQIVEQINRLYSSFDPAGV